MKIFLHVFIRVCLRTYCISHNMKLDINNQSDLYFLISVWSFLYCFAAVMFKVSVFMLILCWFTVVQAQRDIIFELRRIAFDGENDPTGTEKRKAMYTKDYKMLGFTVSLHYRAQFPLLCVKPFV